MIIDIISWYKWYLPKVNGVNRTDGLGCLQLWAGVATCMQPYTGGLWGWDRIKNGSKHSLGSNCAKNALMAAAKWVPTTKVTDGKLQGIYTSDDDGCQASRPLPLSESQGAAAGSTTAIVH